MESGSSLLTNQAPSFIFDIHVIESFAIRVLTFHGHAFSLLLLTLNFVRSTQSWLALARQR